MTQVIKAPGWVPSGKFSVFLGGSIDMGAAENWQDRLSKDLADYSDDLILVNPRRDDWDSSWIQDPTPGTQFYEQVDWELEQQEDASMIVYYFAADSKAPITLLELGIFGRGLGPGPFNVIVCCPKEFYRYGNVKMVCDRYTIKMVESYDDLLEETRRSIDQEI